MAGDHKEVEMPRYSNELCMDALIYCRCTAVRTAVLLDMVGALRAELRVGVLWVGGYTVFVESASVAAYHSAYHTRRTVVVRITMLYYCYTIRSYK